MNKKQAERFAKKVSGEDLPVFLKWRSQSGLNPNWGGQILADKFKIGKAKFYSNVRIIFHRECWGQIRTIDQKVCILHEIGHFDCGHLSMSADEKPLAMREFEAQNWAIEKAREMGMELVAEEAVAWFENWLQYREKTDYNKYRKYYMAAKIAKERGIIQ